MTLTEFYPTPPELAKRMIGELDISARNLNILEPSAGKGDLAKMVLERYEKENPYRHNETSPNVDTIEIDPNLRHILKGEGLRVVHDDFLSYTTLKRYDVVLMNPPFSEGAKHFLKALTLLRPGGQIACLLNAETIRNPHNNLRKVLVQKLEEMEAEIEFIQSAFTSAERTTDVEVALIKAVLPQPDSQYSYVLDFLDKAAPVPEDAERIDALMDRDPLKGMVARYDYEVRAGCGLINEYFAMAPYLDETLPTKGEPGHSSQSRPILSLALQHDNYSTLRTKSEMTNNFLRAVRQKYWRGLFASRQFCDLMTSSIRSEYMSKLGEMTEYEFSLFNIQELRQELALRLGTGVEESILSLFEELSYQHSYYDGSKNIHYYSGWKTNQAYKIHKKVILPLSGFWGDRYYSPVNEKLFDIEKVFDYLDGGRTDHHDLRFALEKAEKFKQTRKIDTKYFFITYYKKGTCHLEFKDLELLKKFNLYGSQRKGWLPPTYGKASYEDMGQEEKDAIDQYEGKASYDKVMADKAYFLVNKQGFNLLASA